MGNRRMNADAWKYACASVIGTSHIKANLPCQDQSRCCLLSTVTGNTFLVALVADGAGSASHSETGATIACEETLLELQAHFEDAGAIEDITREFVVSCIKRIQSAIAAHAEAEQCKPRDFACTFLGVVVGQDRAVFWQIGDGAIIRYQPHKQHEYKVTYWPEKGEYENMTVFVTQADAVDHLFFEFTRDRIEEIALMTDGIQRLALDFQARDAHAPFFRGMFAPLRNEKEGPSLQASQALTMFLNSPKVNERTDDDKTLVLATRRVMPDVVITVPVKQKEEPTDDSNPL